MDDSYIFTNFTSLVDYFVILITLYLNIRTRCNVYGGGVLQKDLCNAINWRMN